MRQSRVTSCALPSLRVMRQITSIARLDAGGETGKIEQLAAVETKSLAGHAILELQRQHAHAHEVGAVDALEALGDHGLHPSSSVPLAAQSRDDPVPYSLPATITSGTPSA